MSKKLTDKPRPKKKPKKLINIIFSQKSTIILLLALQFLFIICTFAVLSETYRYVQFVLTGVALLLAIYIINEPENPAYKIALIVPLLAMPVFTSVLYLMLSNQRTANKLKTLYGEKCVNTRPLLKSSHMLMNKIKQEEPNIYKIVNYVDSHGGYPICENTSAEYFSLGEYKFKAMIEELKKAEKFIFMEYFIIDDGQMWKAVVDILLEKVAQGVEVRLIYDGMGSQFTLPFRYKKKMAEKGIKCLVFNPFRPMMSTIQNNRDHRKILVIDGNVAFNGGVNIADEYINRIDRFGHWKDNAVMIKGEGVWNFTMMFLQMWEVISGEISQYDKYRPAKSKIKKEQGYVLPFADSPLDDENVGEFVYMDIINNAKDYVYITTPYLVPDSEMLKCFEFAAKSGVDVRIITPKHPDKWYVHCITKSFYKELIENGVKIYEYEPGFIHAKTFLSDDTKAVVGTINLDYRSLYLHFECATYMYKSACIKDIKEDFEDMFENKCTQITLHAVESRNIWSKLCSMILKIIAPLL